MFRKIQAHTALNIDGRLFSALRAREKGWQLVLCDLQNGRVCQTDAPGALDSSVECFGVRCRSLGQLRVVGTLQNGQAILMEPGVSEILDLTEGPVLTHKGEWLAWFGGAFVCAVTAISVLFADELFRWNLSFLVRNAEEAEPADWEITGRYASWTLLPVLALVIFLLGLR